MALEVDQIRLTQEQEDAALLHLSGSFVLNFGPHDWRRGAIASTVSEYTEHYKIQTAPRLPATRRRLERLRAATKALEKMATAEDVRQFLSMAAIDYSTESKTDAALGGVRQIAKWCAESEGYIGRLLEQEQAATARGQTGYGANRGKPASRVLIHNLALAWLQAHGAPPAKTIRQKGRPLLKQSRNKFVEFVRFIAEAMLENLNQERRQLRGIKRGIERELKILAREKVVIHHLDLFWKRLEAQRHYLQWACKRLGVTDVELGVKLGVSESLMLSWLAPTTSAKHSKMPDESKKLLARILAGKQE